jgi:hypothetical protein
MQCSATIVVELAPEAEGSQMEAAIQAAGRRAMCAALKQAVRSYEAAHPACPHCGGVQTQPQGTVARRVLTRFGRVVLPLRQVRCDGCGRRRFRPARRCLQALAGGTVTPELGAACALAMFALAYLAVLRSQIQAPQAQPTHQAQRGPVAYPPDTAAETATEAATEMEKGAVSAADRRARGQVTIDRAGDPACTLGGRSSGLSGGCQCGVRLVRLATAS